VKGGTGIGRKGRARGHGSGEQEEEGTFRKGGWATPPLLKGSADVNL